MRYELTHHEWAAIKLMLPNEARGVPRATIGMSSMALLGVAIQSTLARPTAPTGKTVAA
jgi:transposase